MNFSEILAFIKRPVITGLLTFSGLLLLTQLIAYQHHLLFRSTQIKEQVNAANVAKEKLQKALANSLTATQTLSFILKTYGIHNDFDSIAKQLLSSNKYIDALELVKGGTIVNVYPLKGNERALGYNILKDTVRNVEAEKAIARRELYFAGPFNLKQGGVSIVGRLPIFIDDKFWGFSVSLVKLSTLIDAADIDTMDNTDYAYQLSKVNPQTGKEEFFLPNAETFKKHLAVSVEIPMGDWKIYVMPRFSRSFASYLPFAILGLLLSLTGGLFAYYISMQPIELKKLVAQQSRLITVSEENYRNTLDRVSDAFVSLDSNWRFTYMNQMALELFRRTGKNIIGKNIWEEFPMAKDRPFYKAYQEAAAEQKYVYHEQYFEPADLWFENHIYPSSNGLSVFLRDISKRKRAEIALLQSENRYRQLIEEMPEAIFTCDSKGNVQLYNKAVVAILGNPPNGETADEGGNNKIYDKYGKLLRPDEYSTAVCLREGRRIYAEEYTIERPDGKRFHILAHPSPIFDEAGKVTGAVNILVDITERKKAEEEVEKERILSDAIINSLPGIFYLHNSHGKILRWNRNFEIISGYTAEEISQMSPLDFFDGDEKELLSHRIREVFEKGMSDVEANLFTKDKQRIPYYFNGYVGTFYGETCLIGTGIDISNRVKAEQAIRVSEENYRYLFNNNPSLIFIWSLETLQILELNQTALDEYGYSKEETLNMSVLDLRLAEDHAKLKDFAMRMLYSNESIVRGIWRHVRKNGEIMQMDIRSHKIVYQGKQAILSIAENVTQKLLVEAQLQKSFEDIRLLNEHLQTIREEERAGIAREIHDELGQQLTALKMDASWINKRMQHENDEVQERIAGMLSLIDQTVKVVRKIASDLRPGILDDLGLIPALEWQLGEFEKRMGISASFKAEVNGAEIGKKAAIGIFRVFQESLTNVARHADATHVDVYAEQKDHEFCLTIKDNGKGFDTAEIQHKNTLGLIGMSERVRMLQGQLVFDSVKGRGTTVMIKIPVHIKEALSS